MFGQSHGKKLIFGQFQDRTLLTLVGWLDPSSRLDQAYETASIPIREFGELLSRAGSRCDLVVSSGWFP